MKAPITQPLPDDPDDGHILVQTNQDEFKMGDQMPLTGVKDDPEPTIEFDKADQKVFTMGNEIELKDVKSGPTIIDTPINPVERKSRTPDPTTIRDKFKAAALSAGIHLLPFFQAVVGTQSHVPEIANIPEIADSDTIPNGIENTESVYRVYARTFPGHELDIEYLAISHNFEIENPLTFENYGALLRLVYEEKGAEFFDQNINPGYFYLMHEYLTDEIRRHELSDSVVKLSQRISTALAIREGTMTLTDAITQQIGLEQLSENLQRQLANEASMTIAEKVEFYTNATTGKYLGGEGNISTILSMFNMGNCGARFEYKHTINSVNSDKEYFLLMYGPVPGQAFGHIALGHREEDGVIRPVTGAGGEISRPNIYRAIDLVYDLIGLRVQLVEQGDSPPPASLSGAVQEISNSENTRQHNNSGGPGGGEAGSHNNRAAAVADGFNDSQLRAAGMFEGASGSGGTDDDTLSRERSRQEQIRRAQNGELTRHEIENLHGDFVRQEVSALLNHLNLPYDTTLTTRYLTDFIDPNGEVGFNSFSLQQYLRSLPETQDMFERIFQDQLALGLIDLNNYTSADAMFRSGNRYLFDLALSDEFGEVVTEDNRARLQEAIDLHKSYFSSYNIPNLLKMGLRFNFNQYFRIYHNVSPDLQEILLQQDELYGLLDKRTAPEEIDRLYLIFQENPPTDFVAWPSLNEYFLRTYYNEEILQREQYTENERQKELNLAKILNGELTPQESVDLLLSDSNTALPHSLDTGKLDILFNTVVPRLIRETGVNLLNPEVYFFTTMSDYLDQQASADIVNRASRLTSNSYIFDLRSLIYQFPARNLLNMDLTQGVEITVAGANFDVLSELFGKSDFNDEIRAELARRGIEFDPVIRQPIPAP